VIEGFEAEYAIRLPPDYREFLTIIGNGGAGPYYGLYSLEQAVSDEPHHKSRMCLAEPFPLTEAFNPYSEETSDDEIFDDRYICGTVVLAHQGCGYYDRLVVTGPQFGQVWSDGRVSDQGLVPCNLDFYKWYDYWLIDSLASIA
jgi:hypothetical protein